MINLKNILGKIRKIALAVFLIFSTFNALASGRISVIRDSELEDAINEIVSPLVKASGLQSLKIHILLDDSINAFTAGGNEIFLNSGTITMFKDPEIIRGIIAHEMGHVLGHHVLRKVEDVEGYNKVAGGGIAIGLISILTGNPILGIGAIAGGVNYAGAESLMTSRVYESSADQAALKLLEKSGNSAAGLLKLLNYLSKTDPKGDGIQYDLTHPLSTDRISAVTLFLKNSKFKSPTTPENIRRKFLRAAYKLDAFTIPLAYDVQKSGDPEIDTYVSSIKSFRSGKLNESIASINSLLESKPNDTYYNELKGQILFEFGRKDSFEYYDKAVKLSPNDPMIRLSRAVVRINISKDPDHNAEVIDDLKFAISKEPDNIVPIYFLSVAYGKSGDEARSALYNAIMLFKQGNFKDAKMMAKAAIKGLQNGSTEWYKANDIIENP